MTVPEGMRPSCAACRGTGHRDGGRCPDCNVLWIECPTCGTTGQAPAFTPTWCPSKRAYQLACGHWHHLDPDKGGCRSWLGGLRDATAPERVTRTQLERPAVAVGRDARKRESSKRRSRFGGAPS